MQVNNVNSDQGRVKIILDENETASYIPSLFISPGSNLKHSISSIRIKDSGIQELANVIEGFKEDIANHVETKIQLFFYQLFLVYKTGNKVFYDKAYYQAGAKAKKDKDEIKVEALAKPVEAHCATLPTILVGNALEFKNCFINEDRKLTREFLGDKTHYGLSWNMTTTLPACVNHVDSKLEWMQKEKRYNSMTFRQCCVKLLNNSSKGKIDPEIGIKQFLIKGLHYLSSIKISQIHEIYISIFNKYWVLFNEKRIETLKTLTFSVRNENFSFDEHSKQMQEQLSFEVDYRRSISNICPNEPSLVMKGVMLRKTADKIALWLENYIGSNKLRLEKTGSQYVSKCLKNEDFVIDARQYLLEKTMEQLEQDFRNGIDQGPLPGLIAKISTCIGKKGFKNKLNILVHALHKTAILHGRSSEEGIKFRQILCINDSMLDDLLSSRPKLRDAIEKATTFCSV